MNVVHNLPLSFPFPLQILSHVSTGSIILWKGSRRGIWVLLHEKAAQSQSAENEYRFLTNKLRICVTCQTCLVSVPTFRLFTQIVADLMSQERELPVVCSALSCNNTDTPVCPVCLPPYARFLSPLSRRKMLVFLQTMITLH